MVNHEPTLRRRIGVMRLTITAVFASFFLGGIAIPPATAAPPPAIDCNVQESVPQEAGAGRVSGVVVIDCNPDVLVGALRIYAVIKRTDAQVFRSVAGYPGVYTIDESKSTTVGPVAYATGKDTAVVKVEGLCSASSKYYIKWEATAISAATRTTRGWEGKGVSNQTFINCRDNRFTPEFPAFRQLEKGGGWSDQDFERQFLAGWGGGDTGWFRGPMAIFNDRRVVAYIPQNPRTWGTGNGGPWGSGSASGGQLGFRDRPYRGVWPIWGSGRPSGW